MITPALAGLSDIFMRNIKLRIRTQDWRPWLAAFLVVGLLAALWRPLSHFGANPAQLRSWIDGMGPLAPVAFVLLNIVQIVVAPIPGYPVQVLGGLLFGIVPGSIYTVGGMVIGGTLAAWLGRRLGRPWLERRLGEDTLRHWSEITHLNSFWVWWVILLIPLGDIPYFLAGLSRIRLAVFALVILASRGPFTILIVWAGDGVTNLPLVGIAIFLSLVGVVVIIGFSQTGRIEAWGRAYVSRRVAEKASAPDEPR